MSTIFIVKALSGSPVGAESGAESRQAAAGAGQAVLVSGVLGLDGGTRGRGGAQKVSWKRPGRQKFDREVCSLLLVCCCV